MRRLAPDKKHWGIVVILIFSLIISIVGIKHGLPLHLLGDEESIVGGALKMLELRNPIPALNIEAFRLLYYPVGLPYLVIIFSTPVLLWQYISHGLSIAALQDYIIFDQDAMWIAARMVAVISALLMVLVTFKLSSLLINRRAAWFSAAILATSFFHANLSHWIKHWVPATLAAYFTFYLIARHIKRKDMRLWSSGLVAGLSMSISYLVAFGHIISAFYTLIARKELGQRFGKFVGVNVVVFGIAAVFLVLLNYPDFLTQLFAQDSITQVAKSFSGYLTFVGKGMFVLIRQEPVILIVSLSGLIAARKYRRQNLFAFLTVVIYLSLLFIFYHLEPRYLYFIIPALAIAAGTFFDWLSDKFFNRKFAFVLFGLILVYPLAVVIQYDRLLTQPETRLLAQQWIMAEVGETEFIMSSSAMILLRSERSLVREQSISRLRLVERYILDDYDRLAGQLETDLNYTNIHFWPLVSTTDDLIDYLDEYKPVYAILDYMDKAELGSKEYSLIAGSTLVQKFRQSDLEVNHDINGNFFVPNAILFQLERLGPTIEIYEL